MKIVYLIDQIYLHGGIEKILSKKANFLIKANHEVFIITTEQKNNVSSYEYNSKIKQIDLEVNYIRTKSYFHPKNLKNILKNFITLKKVLKQIKPDVVISVSFSPDQYFLPFLKQKKIIKEIHFSGSAIKNGLNKIDYFLFQKLIKCYNYLVLLNEDEKRYYNFKNIKVIPNFIEIDKDKIDFSKKENIILAAGRIAPVKQFDILVKAWSNIAKEFPAWQLNIYGNGNKHLREALYNTILEFNIQNQTKIFNATNKLGEIMKSSKIFAMTSRTECFPMVLLEAKANGLACISFDCPHGPKNIIENTFDGVLVKDQDINDFSLKLKSLLMQNENIEKIGINARHSVLEYSTDKIMKLWLYLFSNNEV